MNGAVRIALIGGFAVAPLLLAPGVAFSFDVTPKTAIVLLAAALCLAFPSGAWPGLRAAWRERFGRWFLILLGLRGLGLVAATALSQNPGVSFAGSRWRQLGLPAELALTALAAAALGYVWGRPERRRALLDWVAAVSIPVSAYAILQYFGIDPLLPRELYYAGQEEWAVVRPPSTFGHAGYFATWAAPAVFLAWWRATEAKGWRQALAVTAAGLLVIAIVLSGTRGALIGLVLGLLMARSRWPRLRSRRVLTTAAIVAMAFLAFVLSPAGARLRTRMIWSAQDYQGGARPWLWPESLALGAERPLTGHGLETFTAAYSRVRSEELALRYPDQTEESPHNVFLDTWVSQGLLGTAALAGITVLALLSARRRGMAGGAFVAALAANQFLAFTAMTEAILLLCATLSVAPGRAAPGGSARTSAWGRAVGGLAAMALVVFALQLAAAETEAERARQLVQAGRVPEAFQAYRRAEALSPPGRHYGEWFARTLYASEAFTADWADTALAELDPERSESPADARYLQAALMAEAGRPASEVESALLASIAAAPTWYKPRWKLAQVLQATGRPDEARPWAESAERLQP